MAEYIDRDRTIQDVQAWATNLNNPKMLVREDAICILQNIPAADVCPYYIGNKHDRGDDSLCRKANCEVKAVAPVRHGRWINQRADSEMCSACGVRFYISALFSVGGNDEPNFCPNCGAKMDGES